MKILVSIYSLHRGGAERVVSLLSQEWSKDHEVVIALSDSTDIAYSCGGKIVDMMCVVRRNVLRDKVRTFLKRIFFLRKVIRRERPDVIFSFMEGTNIASIIASLSVGVSNRLIVSTRNNPVSFKRTHAFFVPLLYRVPRRVVAISEGVRNALVTSLYLPKEKIVTIHNPIDVEYIERKKKEACVLENIHSQTFVAAGRLVLQKDFRTLIYAYSLVRGNKDMDKTNLVILGEGERRKELEKLVCELGLEENVFLPGVVENPFSCFAHAGVFVLSSRYEGLGNVFLEAMTSGCPVVSTDCPYGPGEIIIDGVNGLLVPVGDVERLAEAMKYMMTNSRSVDEFVIRAKETVSSLHVSNVANKWLALLRI
jgi:GalNAc-alpha-(1->4)-GalNAc-alpha-(1->3)-diNAcBac-PP-undecaprenol alpha-1,4-N-acetyl-D-galactosaminyltransferase